MVISHRFINVSDVAVIGLGKIGELVATLLADSGFAVVGYDIAPRDDLCFPARAVDVSDPTQIGQALGSVDAVVSCLPYHLNAGLARAAGRAGVHYFDLTEDVPTTLAIQDLAAEYSEIVFAPQCGLAPGLVGIAGASLAHSFEAVHSVELKVGALPQNPTGLLGYAFNWSSAGVVNEYLNDCEVIHQGRRKFVPAMTGHEKVVIGGIELEAELTSGGLGTMCSSFEGQTQRLDYKTLRYPGHFEQMRFLFDELRLRDSRETANSMLVAAKPPVNDDIVYLHIAVEGIKNSQPLRENMVRTWFPAQIGQRHWRAIAWTTASSVVGVVELVAAGQLPTGGFLRQEDINLQALFATRAGARFDRTRTETAPGYRADAHYRMNTDDRMNTEAIAGEWYE